MNRSPTYIGTVQDVQGATIGVVMDKSTVSGLSFIDGEGYRIGQMGSFVKISIGFLNLYGIVSQVGASALPDNVADLDPYGQRWLRIQLVGEGHAGQKFQRGLSQYPTIGDNVHLVTESDLRAIYGHGELDDYVSVGCLASSESIPALVNINKLVTRHSAILGTTGSGKSTTVAGLIRSLSDKDKYPSARILIMDIHGEYERAFKGLSSNLRVGASQGGSTAPLYVPYWALNFDELCAVCFDGPLEGNRLAAVADAVLELKREGLRGFPCPGITEHSLSVDSPVPFSIHKLWLDLHIKEYKTVIPAPGGDANERIPAYVLDESDQPVETGDAMRVVAPIFRSVKTTGPAEERVQHANEGANLRQPLAALASKLRDPRYAFIFRPGEFLPNENGVPSADLDSLLHSWVGGEQPVTILDLSGIPASILDILIGALLRVLYDALFWARKLPEGGQERPLLLVLEEAHSYLNSERNTSAGSAVKRIAKEGRKYGVGLMIVSQRPSEVDSTVLSQCGTIFSLRLSNDSDRGQVVGASADNLKGLFDMLPILRIGEAIIVGESVSLPIRCLVKTPPVSERPDSLDPAVVARGSEVEDGFSVPGGWNQKRDPVDYIPVVRQWRSQSSDYIHAVEEETTTTQTEGENDNGMD
ncbi:hypothetical protein J3R74_000560 [Puniceicoccus vermicola]|uniref:ATP-binding protein n=2 Tax=Puniceicoccus vermicola TaxID=388746 RepID=A0A7X1AVZ4_9BACT|nr:ATP-binding protein [Puniceicoccus vermicola]